MKASEPIDVLRKAFPGLRWTRTPKGDWFDYVGKGPLFHIRVKQWEDEEKWELRVLFLGHIVIASYSDARLSRLCARTADRLRAIAEACVAAAPVERPLLPRGTTFERTPDGYVATIPRAR